MEFDRRTQQALWVVFAIYLLLLGLYVFTDFPLAEVGVELAFILIVLIFAGVTYREFGSEPLSLLTSVSLSGAAITAAVNLLVEIQAVEVTSNVLLLVGIGLYLYLRWSRS